MSSGGICPDHKKEIVCCSWMLLKAGRAARDCWLSTSPSLCSDMFVNFRFFFTFRDFNRQLQVFSPAKPWKKHWRLFTGLKKCVKGKFKPLNTGEMICKDQPWGERMMTLHCVYCCAHSVSLWLTSPAARQTPSVNSQPFAFVWLCISNVPINNVSSQQRHLLSVYKGFFSAPV